MRAFALGRHETGDLHRELLAGLHRPGQRALAQLRADAVTVGAHPIQFRSVRAPAVEQCHPARHVSSFPARIGPGL